MSVKFYMDLMSQPSRALYIFMKTTNIPFEKKVTSLKNGENYKDGFEKISPFNKLPVIQHNGFNLTESVAIVRYLAREFNVEDHWYPKDSKAQAKVDEYLEWQHLNTRLHCASYFAVKFLWPIIKGQHIEPKTVVEHEARMIECLDQIENIWLKDNKPFLVGDRITVADLFGACEIEQPRVGGFNPREGRPVLTAWLDRVAKETAPYYEEAHSPMNKVTERNAKQSKL